LNVVVLRLVLFCFSAVIAKQLPHTAREKNGPGAKCWLDAVNWRKAVADSRPARGFLLVDPGDQLFRIRRDNNHDVRFESTRKASRLASEMPICFGLLLALERLKKCQKALGGFRRRILLVCRSGQLRAAGFVEWREPAPRRLHHSLRAVRDRLICAAADGPHLGQLSERHRGLPPGTRDDLESFRGEEPRHFGRLVVVPIAN